MVCTITSVIRLIENVVEIFSLHYLEFDLGTIFYDKFWKD